MTISKILPTEKTMRKPKANVKLFGPKSYKMYTNEHTYDRTGGIWEQLGKRSSKETSHRTSSHCNPIISTTELGSVGAASKQFERILIEVGFRRKEHASA